MDSLRFILKWIGRHRVLSIVSSVIVLAAGLMARNIWVRSQGMLSAPIERGRIVESVYGIGTVMANRSYQIKVGVISHIFDLYIKEGDAVKKGDKLVNLDSIIYRAPFDGTVTFLPYKVGENVFTNFPILSLVDLSDRYLVVSLEQQGALQVQRGQSVKMSFDTMRDQNYDGVVESVYSNNSNFLARINISQLPFRILPDMTADVAIKIHEHDDALLIPAAAFDRGYVWARRGRGVARRVAVKTGIVDKDAAEIISGDLQPGDRVLIKGKLSR